MVNLEASVGTTVALLAAGVTVVAVLQADSTVLVTVLVEGIPPLPDTHADEDVAVARSVTRGIASEAVTGACMQQGMVLVPTDPTSTGNL